MLSSTGPCSMIRGVHSSAQPSQMLASRPAPTKSTLAVPRQSRLGALRSSFYSGDSRSDSRLSRRLTTTDCEDDEVEDDANWLQQFCDESANEDASGEPLDLQLEFSDLTIANEPETIVLEVPAIAVHTAFSSSAAFEHVAAVVPAVQVLSAYPTHRRNSAADSSSPVAATAIHSSSRMVNNSWMSTAAIENAGNLNSPSSYRPMGPRTGRRAAIDMGLSTGNDGTTTTREPRRRKSSIDACGIVCPLSPTGPVNVDWFNCASQFEELVDSESDDEDTAPGRSRLMRRETSNGVNDGDYDADEEVFEQPNAPRSKENAVQITTTVKSKSGGISKHLGGELRAIVLEKTSRTGRLQRIESQAPSRVLKSRLRMQGTSNMMVSHAVSG